MNSFIRSDETLLDHAPELTAQVASLAADVALVVDGDNFIVDATISPDDSDLIADANWVGREFLSVIQTDSRVKAEALLADARAGKKPRWRQLNHPNDGGEAGESDLPVDYMALRISDDGRCLLFGRDLRNVALLQQRLLRAQQALERDYERYRSTENRYRQLFHLSGEPILVVSSKDAFVLEANAAARDLLGPAGGNQLLEGSRFPQDFDVISERTTRGKLTDYLTQTRTARRARPFELTVQPSSEDGKVGPSILYMNAVFISDMEGGHFILRFTPGETALLPAAPTETNVEQRLMLLIDHMPEAFVVTDRDGSILFANSAFVDMTETEDGQILRGRDVEDWLVQPGLSLNALATSLRSAGVIRLLYAKIRGDLGAERDVELSAVLIADGGDDLIGFVVRDLGPAVARSSQITVTSKDAVQQMTELVGRMSLKDIVRETTDVIERMCIEAALKITNNNRVSAADILGVSRQSLYVKMRRFDITGNGEEE